MNQELLFLTISFLPRHHQCHLFRGVSSHDETAFLIKDLEQQVTDKEWDRARYLADEQVKLCSVNNVKVITILDQEYPRLLKNIEMPPLALYVRGLDFKKLCAPNLIAVVGSRNSNRYGEENARRIAFELADNNITVVSGLAYGIDAAAHSGALDSTYDCPTIAVLGHGLDFIYPRAHFKLAEKIIESGGYILSPFPIGTKPLPPNFLGRNRIIAGMSQGVLVIQATERSGALSTANAALDMSREVMALPGSINDFRCAGSNELIKNGARVVTEIKDIVSCIPDFEFNQGTRSRNIEFKGTDLQMKIIHKLKDKGETLISEIISELGEIGFVSRELLELEMAGQIVRIGGGNKVVLR